jgi:hypothetical protein
VLIVFGSTSVRAQTTKQQDPCSERQFLPLDNAAPTVTATDIRNLPQCFNGKFIRVVGIYRRIFENSDFYDPTGGGESTWVSFDADDLTVKRCSPSSAIHRLLREDRGTFGFIATGILRRGGGFGHLLSWQNELQVTCIETVVALSKSGNLLYAQEPNARKRILDWYAKQISHTTPSNKSLDASGGGVFRIIIGPAMVE